MHDLALFNGQITSASVLRVDALSVAALYGKGVFTTVAIYNGKPFLWDKHWHRLMDNSERLEIGLSQFTEDSMRNALHDLILQNGVNNGRARITVFDESASDLWSTSSGSKISLLITTADFTAKRENLRLGVSPYRVNTTSPLAGVKSTNYLERIVALASMRNSGSDEAVQLNERDEIASALMANMFWLKEGQLFTPSLATGCLPGTTREFVIENLKCGEVEAGITELESADEIFLTSAGIGVIQVSEFHGRALLGRRHPIAELIPPG
ncbi:MAG TPA: aminotransferase class IV [Pyrinomonadaceae bacterium]